MRELIYLSHRKLAMFAPLRGRLPWSRFRPRLDVTVPGFASLGFEDQGDTQQHSDLETVIQALHNSECAPLWYEDPKVSAGQWVQFEARMNWCVLDKSRFKTTVVFFDSYTADTHLLLHGSSIHLLGQQKPARMDDLHLERIYAESETFEWYCEALPDSIAATTGTELESLALDPKTTDPSVTSLADVPRPVVNSDNIIAAVGPQELLGLYDSLSRAVNSATATWMGGLARVTATFSNPEPGHSSTVVATPLYVEFVNAPPTDLT
jgi:hypothetical protein